MNASSRGYSTGFIDEVNAADNTKVGVQLALACIMYNISVMEIAEHFDVSRTTVYAWFKGESNVPKKHYDEINKVLRELYEANK
jgi:hypothetical protein